MQRCLEELSVEMLPANQSLMGLMRHGVRIHTKKLYIYITIYNMTALTGLLMQLW